MAPEMHRIALKNPKKALAHPFGTQKKGLQKTALPFENGRFKMPSALLWAASAEHHFYICRSGKSADFPVLPFHERGRSEKRQLTQKGTAAQRCAAVPCMGVIAFYLPASSTASTAFWTCRRFSASSKISSACCSNRAVEISSPRWAGRQCSTSTSGLAFSSRRPVS